jgi:hypothetical protein
MPDFSIGGQVTTSAVVTTAMSPTGTPAVVKRVTYGEVVSNPITVLTGAGSAVVHATAYTSAGHIEH